MSLTRGTRLGPYEITARIGEGGMGEVYRAHDTKLGRDIALKLLPDSVAHDPDRRVRFEREAKTLAALNHPNIAQIYGIEERSPSSLALAMELVDGRTLADVIGGRAMPFSDALPIIRQIVDALEAAHEKAIIHRDLKPANIMVTVDGQVKVLDFGLARTADAAGSDVNVANSPTLTHAGTQVGVILGTARYMSPEQARGRAADRRSDVWAFGCVCYELLSGQPPFGGEEVADILAAVLRSDPDWSALPHDVPPAFRTVIQRCLARDRKARVPDFSVVRFLLEDALANAAGHAAPATPAPPVRSGKLLWVALACTLGGALVTGAAAWLTRASPAPPRVERFLITTPGGAPFQAPNLPGVAISQDGSRVVYHTSSGTAGSAALYLRESAQIMARPIPGTGGASAGMFFSASGDWIAFAVPGERALKKIPIQGGTPQLVCTLDAPFVGGSWGLDDQIVVALATKGLVRVSAAGGQPQVLTRLDPATGELDHRWPDVLPDGRGVLFTAWHGSPERSRIAVLSPDGRISTLVSGGTQPHFARPGYLTFAVDNTLRAVRFDPATLSAIGQPVTIVEGVGMTTQGGSQYAIGGDGSLVYVTGGNIPRTLVWVDRQGREEAIHAPAREYVYARLSPDGTRIALDARDQENDIWIWDLRRETLQRLTTSPGLDRVPVWTPDGTRIAFMAQPEGAADGIYWQAADGSGVPERLSIGTAARAPESFTPDGRRLIFSAPITPPYDIGVLSLDGERREEMLLTTRFSESNGVVSPDGRWLAYQSDDSGRTEIYVSPFPTVSSGKQPVSNEGGTRPLWSRDGRELFYYASIAGVGTIMAVPVVPGPTLSLGKPQALTKGQYFFSGLAGRHYDVSLDGKRLLLLKEVEGATGEQRDPQIHIVLNWTEELKQKVGK